MKLIFLCPFSALTNKLNQFTIWELYSKQIVRIELGEQLHPVVSAVLLLWHNTYSSVGRTAIHIACANDLFFFFFFVGGEEELFRHILETM